MNLFKLWNERRKRTVFQIANCGHEAKRIDKVSAFGETIETEVPLINGKIEYCHECLAKMTIRCVWCGRPIFIGDFITLYSPSKEFEIPTWVVIYKKEPLQLVGCQRTDCADSGSDYCGTWIPPGIVHRQQSGIEAALSNPESIILGHNENGKIHIETIEHRKME